MYIFFFNDTATTEIYTLSLHDALPIFRDGLESRDRDPGLVRGAGGVRQHDGNRLQRRGGRRGAAVRFRPGADACRSEEHTSELQSRQYLVCRLLLEKKKIYEISLLRLV